MTLLVESTVLAAIISGLISIIIAKSQNKLQYITLERKEWREQIREIAERIHKSKRKGLSDELSCLKVRLNAYGMNQPGTSLMNESHIWKLIEELEEKSEDKSIFEERKKLLIEYLALLLKLDWERSKREVRGERFSAISYIMLFMSYVVFAYSMYTTAQNSFVLTSEGKIFYIVTLILLDFILFFVVGAAQADIADQILDLLYSRQAPESHNYKRVTKCALMVFMVLYCGFVIMIFVEAHNAFGVEVRSNINLIFIGLLFFILNLLAVYIKYQDVMTSVSKDLRYYESVITAKNNALNRIIKILCKNGGSSIRVNYSEYFHSDLSKNEKEVITALIGKNLLDEA